LEHSSDTEADALVSVAARKLAEEEDICELLQERLGRLHARLRLGIEADHEAQVFGQGINYFIRRTRDYRILSFGRVCV
jgi:hypothetical protein